MNKKAAETTDTPDDELPQAPATLTGDVRDFLLGRLKGFQKPWQQMTESEQASQIACATDAAERLVKKIVKIVAADGRTTVEVNLEQITIKDGIKAVVTCTNTQDNREGMGGATGQVVLLVVAGGQQFVGQSKEAKPDPDQANLLDSAKAYDENAEGDVPDPEDEDCDNSDNATLIN